VAARAASFSLPGPFALKSATASAIVAALTRYLHVADYVEIAAQVLNMRREELCVEQVVELAHAALDAPSAEAGDCEARHELYPNLADKAAVMCGRLLKEPPLREEAAFIAYRCLELFLLSNRAEWKEEGQRTIILFNRILAAPEEARDLFPYMRERVTEPEQRGAESTRPTLFTVPESNPTVVYLAGPLKNLASEDRPQLELAEAQVEAALRTAQERAGAQIDIKLEHPSTRLCQETAPEICDEEVWQYTSRQLVESADALIVTDIAVESAGFGATSELDLHCQQEGPILYLRSTRARRSRILDARSAEVDLEIVEYAEIREIEAIVSEWMTKRWHAVRSASRRRDDRQFIYGPIKRRLENAWQRASPRRRELAAHAAGMKPRMIDRVLTSISLLSVLPSHRLDALCRELGVPAQRTQRQQAAIDASSAPDLGALLMAAEEERWPAEKIISLYRHTGPGGSRPAYKTRASLQQKADWKKLHRDLGL
jgi:hypothetical protein